MAHHVAYVTAMKAGVDVAMKVLHVVQDLTDVFVCTQRRTLYWRQAEAVLCLIAALYCTVTLAPVWDVLSRLSSKASKKSCTTDRTVWIK